VSIVSVPRALIVSVGFLLAGLLGLGAYFLPVFQAAGSTAGAGAGAGAGAVTNLDPFHPSSGPFTVLLLGSDDDSKFPPERLNTQSMILVRVDPAARQATMLSIPRDLWVPIPNQGVGKISTAYQLGGAPAAIAAVESNFNVHIDDYAWIGLNGLVKVIDQLGGVDVLVTNPVLDDFYPSDLSVGGYPYDYYRVALLPGAVHLDGVHALQYVRSRHGDLRGDFARSERQQQVLLSIKAQASHLNVADLPTLAKALNGEIKSSLGLTRVRQLISIANDFDGTGTHRIVLVPPYTSEGVVAGQDVVIPNWAQILPLAHQSFP
jgi:LCP family protein required for cell wall assembly